MFNSESIMSPRYRVLVVSLIVLIAFNLVIVPALADAWVPSIGFESRSDGIHIEGARGESLDLKILVKSIQSKGGGQDPKLSAEKDFSPGKSVKHSTFLRKTERLDTDELYMDFFHDRFSNNVKFDIGSLAYDVFVRIQVTGGESTGYLTWADGRLSLDLSDLEAEGALGLKVNPNGVSFTIPAYTSLDPLVKYNETAGTYQWGAYLGDYAPAVVIPAAYTDNVTLHVPGQYANNVTALYDYLLMQYGEYQISGDMVQFEFILENLRPETDSTLTDNQTSGDGSEWVKYDDYQAGFEAPAAEVTFSNETVIVRRGVNSTKIVAVNRATGSIIRFTADIDHDLSGMDFLVFEWYGNGTGYDLAFALRNGVGSTSWAKYFFVDDFSGWRTLSVPILAWDDMGAGWGLDDLVTIDDIYITSEEAGTVSGTWYLDRVRFDSHIWNPFEVYVPDNTLNMTVYSLDSTGADPQPVFTYDFNGTLENGVYYGNLRNLEDEYISSIAKTDVNQSLRYTLNTTLQAGTLADKVLNLTAFSQVELTRMSMPADYVNNKLFTWNPEQSEERGTPWFYTSAGDPTSNFRGGDVGSISINSGTSVYLHSTTFPTIAPGVYAEVAGNTRFNWQHDVSADTYSYEFYLDNDNVAPQNATIEMNIPNTITTYTLSYWNGTDYIEFMDYATPSISQPKTIDQTSIDAAIYTIGQRGESKAVLDSTPGLADIGNIIYSANNGVIKGVGFTVELGANDGDAAAPDGADEIKLKVTVNYANDGESTYEFEDSANQYWGLDNLDNQVLMFFDPDVAQPSPYVALINEGEFTDLYICADENQSIKWVEFTPEAGNEYVVLTGSADSTATITAPTGETISELIDRWGYLANTAQFLRGERRDYNLGIGSDGFAMNISDYAGIKYRNDMKVPLAPWDGYSADEDSGRSQARYRVEIWVAPDDRYSYTADLNVPAEAAFMTSLFLDVNPGSINPRPDAPAKNTTITPIWYGKLLNITYVDDILSSAEARRYIRYLTINGSRTDSMVIPTGYLTGAPNRIDITAPLGYPRTPVTYGLNGCNLTSSTWNADLETLQVITAKAGGGTGLIYVYSSVPPARMVGELWYAYDPATNLLTIQVSHSSPNTVLIYFKQAGMDWASSSMDNLQLAGLAIFATLAVMVIGVITGTVSVGMILPLITGLGAAGVIMLVIGQIILRLW